MGFRRFLGVVACSVALIGFAAGCLEEAVQNSCTFGEDGLVFSGDCSFDLNQVVDGLRDRIED